MRHDGSPALQLRVQVEHGGGCDTEGLLYLFKGLGFRALGLEGVSSGLGGGGLGFGVLSFRAQKLGVGGSGLKAGRFSKVWIIQGSK